MKSFIQLTATAAYLDWPNVDTDLLIPKQFLISIERHGFGRYLFNDLRYLEDGSENSDFILNQAPYRGAAILVARENFGCGSSREHAAWALDDYGFRVVIAPSFGDIFFNNALNVGLVLVTLPADKVGELIKKIKEGPGLKLTVSLRDMTVADSEGFKIDFFMDGHRRERYLNGWDEIDLTLNSLEAIETYEKARSKSWEAALPV
jgi:3-isopropylmalate/(R)-2-methylmalate dehydratase small subunit